MNGKIQLGMVGGGAGSFIGPVHRIAARMTDEYELVAGVFSSKPEKSMSFAKQLGIVENRAYADWKKMLSAEQNRTDGIEVVAIMTPNDTHFPIAKAFLEAGVHIICDKPLCNTIENAQYLRDATDKSDRVFCVTYNYSAYPMVKQARAMVANGDIGDIRQVQLTYVQGNLASYSPSEEKSWRLTDQGGASLVLSDIATHAFHLGEYVTRTEIEQIYAEVDTTVPQRSADDYVSCLLRFKNGAKGTLWVTNAAAGAEHGLGFKIFGSQGGLEWHQEQPNELRHRSLHDFERILTRRKDGKLYSQAENSVFLEFGHPEGYNEAFSNLYQETATAIRQVQQGEKVQFPDGFPNAIAGERGVRFIHTCLISNATQKWCYL
ncbi:MAG: Gfo/Idh/MocA family oxidoreductase [Bacteroidota bacterium]